MQTIVNHCNQYKKCKGCPLAGDECTAPMADFSTDKWSAWINEMKHKIHNLKPTEPLQ